MARSTYTSAFIGLEYSIAPIRNDGVPGPSLFALDPLNPGSGPIPLAHFPSSPADSCSSEAHRRGQQVANGGGIGPDRVRRYGRRRNARGTATRQGQNTCENREEADSKGLRSLVSGLSFMICTSLSIGLIRILSLQQGECQKLVSSDIPTPSSFRSRSSVNG